MQPGYVYIIHGKGTNYIKVGKTTNVQRRLGQIAAGVPFKITLVSAQLVHDMDHEEQVLKTHFQAFRTRGEWFEVSSDVLALWPLDFIPELPVRIQPVRPMAIKLSLGERLLTL